jgi:HEAT repeat protein
MAVGDLMVECERHLRSWKSLMSAPRSTSNRSAIATTEKAIATLAHREQPQLEKIAVSGAPRNRAIASAALGFCADPAALPLLLNNVSAEDDLVASSALLGLGMLADESTALSPVYERVMDINATDSILQNAAFATLRIADKLRNDENGTLSSIMVALLGSELPKVRGQALIGLGLIKAAHTVPLLQEKLKDDIPDNRLAAAWALGEISSIGSTPSLLEALSDEDTLVAGAARAALAKIYGQDWGKNADDWATPIEAATIQK